MTIVLNCEEFQICVYHLCNHPPNLLMDMLESVSELIDKIVANKNKLSNRELRKMGHIRKKTRKTHNKR